MPAQTLNLGPSKIAEASIPGGPNFALSRPEWIAIQTYVIDALALPTDEEAFRKSLGPGAPKDVSTFASLIAAYKAINEHVTRWDKTVYPASVDLASDIYQYGVNKAPAYYKGILKYAEQLERNPDDERAKAALKAVLDNLQQDARARAAKADEVAKQIAAFAADTERDRDTMVGPKGLVKQYEEAYGNASKEVADITKEIAAQRELFKAANAEYDHDVVVAATTPTYFIVYPFGTIAAVIVAGIYGDLAAKALDRARAAQAKIAALDEKRAADTNLLIAIHSAEMSMNAIARDLAAALPVIQKIQGVWGGIAADLGAIISLIENDIRAVPPLIMDIGVDEAITAWRNVALTADAYRVNAYVKQDAKLAAAASDQAPVI